MINLTNIKRMFLWALISVLCTYNPITHINTFATTQDDTKDDDGDETDDDDGDEKITINQVKDIAAKLKLFADQVIKEALDKNPTYEQGLRTHIFKKIPVIVYTDGSQKVDEDEGIRSILSPRQIEYCKGDFLVKLEQKWQSISLFGALMLILDMDPSSFDNAVGDPSLRSKAQNKIALTNRTIVMSTHASLVEMLSNDFVKDNTSKNVQDSLKAMFKPYESIVDIVGVGEEAIENSYAKELKSDGFIWKENWVQSKQDDATKAFYTGVLVSAADTDIHKKLLAKKPSDDSKDKDKSQGWTNTYVGAIASGTLALGTVIGYFVGGQNASQPPKKSSITSLLDEDDD